MDTRRAFIKKAAMLSGAAGFVSAIPPSIQKALEIDPVLGSAYTDAEHIVILMQENRSFDHCYGALQGVRGFNDPRAITLPDKDKVWLQKNASGQAFVPFRLNIKETKSTWIGSLPHSWTNQVDARNNGKYDKWLIAKPSGNAAFADAPLTLGYYDRNDIPFYYSLADAFTVCDQNFCSSLTGTTPNRLYLWTGTIRESHEREAYAHTRNEDVNYSKEVNWKTFPERLEENGISWKIYQNEISLDSGLTGEEDSWLTNFTDNPIEWFSQYHVRFAKSYQNYLDLAIATFPEEIRLLKNKLSAGNVSDQERKKIAGLIEEKEKILSTAAAEKIKWSRQNFEKLSPFEKNCHQKAFSINDQDPFYRQLETITYNDGGVTREMKAPKGDILFQFRKDVEKGELPTVSWIVGPENFSDHPGAPWYGAWYVSEVMDILTKDPEVWKKTIFILCYDENDGYFDHVPPFVAPDPETKGTGRVSAQINAFEEQSPLAQDLKTKSKDQARGGPIGLGFRVPLVIASPWSRGGAVCSQVFDHTSILQFMEKFLSQKFNKKIEETNISGWRRAVCGDLTSVFKPYQGEKIRLPEFLERSAFIESVHKAQFKKDPFGYRPLTHDEINRINLSPSSSGLMPRQEKGSRDSCPLPYQLEVEGKLNVSRKAFDIQFTAGNEIFGARSAGSAFTVYAPGKYKSNDENGGYENARNWAYAVVAGDSLKDSWPLEEFDNSRYHLRVYGPNGFYREFTGNEKDPLVDITLSYDRDKRNAKKLNGDLSLALKNSNAGRGYDVEIMDNAYGAARKVQKLGKAAVTKGKAVVRLNLSKSHGWYDITVRIKGEEHFEKRYAGHIETGQFSRTDPAMGMV